MYSKIIFAGALGRDPAMRYLPSGQAVTNLNVATNRTYKDGNGQKVTETLWFRVSVWGAMAESSNQYLKKGSKVMIEGRLNPDPETGSPKIFIRNDGSAGSSYEVTAQQVVFLSSKGEDNNPQQEDPFPEGGFSENVDEDSIPF